MIPISEALDEYLPHSYVNFISYQWSISEEDQKKLLRMFENIKTKCLNEGTVMNCDKNIVRNHFTGEIANQACILPWKASDTRNLEEYIDALFAYLLQKMIDVGFLRDGFKSIEKDDELYKSLKIFY